MAPLAAMFLHPWMAAAGAGMAALPILIHLLNRRRYRRVVWAAMEFLLAANRRQARRLRIEQWLLLAVRTIIMVLMAVALARPILQASPLAQALGRASAHRLLLFDNSYSMGMPSGPGRTAFGHAVDSARRLTDSFDASDGVSLITLAGPAQAIFERPVHDPSLVSNAIDQLERFQRSTDLLGGLARAAKIAEDSDSPRESRFVYVLTDNARSAWFPSAESGEQAVSGVVEAARRLMEAARLHIVVVGDADRPNVAVTDLATQTRVIGVGGPATFTSRIRNASRQPIPNISAEFRVDGRVVRNVDSGRIEPRGSANVTFTIGFPEAGSHRIEFDLQDEPSDALAVDNRRFLSVVARRSVPVLLVDGKPGLTRFDGQAGYLATALAPITEAVDSALLAPRIVLDSDLAGEPFADFAVIALCNVRRLDAAVWARLADFVREGGGLIVFLGDQVSAEHYNRAATGAAAAGLLPAKLSTTAEAPASGEPFRFSPHDYSHPVLADFADAPRGGLLLTSIYRYIRVNPPADAAGERTILRFDSGDPAIVEGALGEGRVMLFTTTANMEWTNFAARGGYLPIMQNLFHHAAPSVGAHRNQLVGATLSEPLSARQSSLALSVVRPDGTAGRVQLQPIENGFEALMTETDPAGIYELHVGSETTHFAANLDPAESDLSEIDERELREHLGDEVSIWIRPEQLEESETMLAARDLGPRMLYLVLALLLVETWLAMRFGRQR